MNDICRVVVCRMEKIPVGTPSASMSDDLSRVERSWWMSPYTQKYSVLNHPTSTVVVLFVFMLTGK